jgi:hypothetical protein
MFKTIDELLMEVYIEWKRLYPEGTDDDFKNFLEIYVKPFAKKENKD